ncbi:MAG: 50S ribosomal protein L15 [Bdellovibrio sp.]|nr:MAG: 50S ribosomal protein L15 [Bdellovibrio sp.]
MAILSQLAPVPGSKHYRKRLGRGRGSGLGQTSAKGHKGQIARSGGRVRRGFEGGQSPLSRRLPKFGFNNKDFRTEYSIVNLDQLNRLEGVIGPEELVKSGIIHKGPVKILSRGTLSKALTVRAHRFSTKAKEHIEKAGGKTEVLELKS